MTPVRFVDAVFACCCVAIAGGTAARWLDPAETHAAREQVIAAGAADPFGLVASSHAPGARLYVMVSTSCRVCTDSLPFYRQLADAGRRAGGDVRFVGIERDDDIRAYLQRAGIGQPLVTSVARPPNVPGTPTIVAVDAGGRVARSWAGRLNRRQEREVLAVLAAAAPASRFAAPAPVAAVLAAARARLSGSRRIDTVSRIELAGTETTLFDSGARESAYAIALEPPALLEMRSGPVVHTLSGGAYSRRLADPVRFGGPVAERLMRDPESIRVASHGMRAHLLRLSLTYLARAEAAAVHDEGVRDFGAIKGRTIAFTDPVEGEVRAELVVDPVSFDPLGVVTPVRTEGRGGRAADGSWISIPGDYREVGGVRVPHRIEDWIGFTHVRVTIMSVRVR
jgi:hypothetical protein